VLLKQPPANVHIQGLCNKFHQDIYPLLKCVSSRALHNGIIEELLDIRERVLIHGINHGEVTDHKVEDAPADRDLLVRVSCLVDGLLDLLGFNQALLYEF